MAVLLNEYDAVKVRNIDGTFTFLVPMGSPTDVILADLATELNAYDGNMIYDHVRYRAIDGVKKDVHWESYVYNAVITAREV